MHKKSKNKKSKNQKPKKESKQARENRRARVKDYYQRHKDYFKKNSKLWYDNHPGYAQKNNKKWYEKNKEERSLYARKLRSGEIGKYKPEDCGDWQEKNREIHLAKKRANTNKRRKEVFIEALEYYSPTIPPSCYCCGESEPLLLGLDHINGGGNKHRKELKGTRLYEWAKRNNWPSIFRIACHSCNLGSHLNGGICPHKK